MELWLPIAVLLVIFWFWQLLDLMRRRDEEFPGRLDKVAWTVIVVFTGPLGAFAFLLGKPARKWTNEAGQEKAGSSLDEAAREKARSFLEEAGREPAGPALAENTCLRCGGPLPEGPSKCPACGWSYESPGGT
jgi:hypothetical protein